MVRGNRNKSSAGGGGAGNESWSFADHAVRLERKMRRRGGAFSGSYKRTGAAHDTSETRDRTRTRLHVTKVEREIAALRTRMTAWDDAAERRREEEEERRRRAAAADEEQERLPKRRRLRPGPETWRLRGAARPAHEVYDFDTRYVCPHAKEREEHDRRVARSRNLFALYRGRFGETTNDDDDGPPPVCRRFLSLLAQSGHLNVEAKRFKSAREAFKECLDLEGDDGGDGGDPPTDARYRLMRLCLEANRPDSARRLWERLPPDEGSVWIRYSAALVEYASWRLLKEEGSTREVAREALLRAVRTNVFCGLWLRHRKVLESVVEYADEVEDVPVERTSPSSALLQAIEYCRNSEQMGAWLGTDGALEWLAEEMSTMAPADLDWRARLQEVEDEHAIMEQGKKASQSNEEEKKESDSIQEEEEEEEDDDDVPLDVLMYAGMFRTAMEMVESDVGDRS